MIRLVFSLYVVSVTVGLQGNESSCADGRVASSWSNWICVSGTTATRNGYCEDSRFADITETAKNCSTCGHKSVKENTDNNFVSCCNDSVSWTQPWTCDSTTFKTASRVGECTSDGVPVEVTQTVNVSVYSWTSWSPWFPRCGSDHRGRSRSCEVPSSDVPFCSTCGYQNVTASQKVPANLPPCCENYPFGPWSPWIPDCSPHVNGVTPVSQSRTRSRECDISSDCTPCPLDVETRTGILQSWSDWGEWSGSVGPCSEKVYRSRRRSCPNVTNPESYPVTSCCNRSRENVEYSCSETLHTKSTKMPVQTEPTVICSHHKGSSTDSITNVPFHSSLPTSTLSPCTSSSFASTSTSSPGSESAYEWPVIAMSMFTVIASAVLIVTIVVFALLCKKKRQQGYHTLLQQELHYIQPSLSPDEDLPLDPPPPYTAHTSDLTGCGPVDSEDTSCSSDVNNDPVNTEEVRELFNEADVALPLFPPEKKEEEILTTATHTAQM